MKATNIRRLQQEQKGMVAIIVTMIVMIVLTLIVLGFAQLARREQRQALDRQLSTQAYYAAESGINVARDQIYNSNFDADITDCTGPNSASAKWGAGSTTLSTDSNSNIPCLLVDQRLETLEYSSVGDQSTVAPLTSETGNFKEITFSWQAKNGSTDFNCGDQTGLKFPPVSGWKNSNCSVGLLRVDLIDLGVGNIDRGYMVNNTFTAFFYPSASGGNNFTFGSASGANQGQIYRVRCSAAATPKHCKATVNVDALGHPRFYVRFRSVYVDSSVTVNGVDTANDAATFVGAQAKIDVTGKTADVTRRVQVHIPSTKASQVYNFPSFVLETADSICKRLSVVPGEPVTTDATNPACALN